MTAAHRFCSVLVTLVSLAGCPGLALSSHPAGSADTTGTGLREREEGAPGRFLSSPADTIHERDFRERHAFSLGQFFEGWPGLSIGRLGPLGADAYFSRYGMGRGRGALYLGTVALNDPQDDRVPLGLVPTTAFGRLVTAASGGYFVPDAANIEGAYRIEEPGPPSGRPIAAFELSKGDRNLRQRRVRLSSTSGPIGLDFEFDELLNDGYGFDAREVVSGPGYGRTSARVQGGNLRGETAGGVEYLFSLRRFESEALGDLVSADAVQRRDGHLAVIRSSYRGAGLSIFEKSHRVSSPDSATSNHTAGISLSVPVDWGATDIWFGGAYEDIHSRQRMGEEVRSRLQKGHLGAAGKTDLPGGIATTLRLNATHYFDGATGWGAGLFFARSLGARQLATFEFRRRFRMPNLGELYQPRHPLRMNPSIEIEGDPSIGEESALEGSAAWTARIGGFTNEIRATAMRVRDPILYQPTAGGAALIGPRNGDTDDLFVVEDRAHFRGTILGTLIEVAGSIEHAPGEKGPFFSGVPEYRATAWAGIGRDFFKNTSGIRLNAEYQHGGPRSAGSVDALPSYDVVNLRLLVRLIDAHLYLQWLNVTEEKYQTVWPYLMTPRTFVYGVEWTLFD